MLLGEQMPKKIASHSMASSNGDLYVFGGMDSDQNWPKDILKLNWSNGWYQWTTINQKLNVPRAGFPSIPVADSFCKPNNSSKLEADYFYIVILISLSMI